MDEPCCETCGTPLPEPSGNHRQRRYCSQRCGDAHRTNARPTQRSRLDHLEAHDRVLLHIIKQAIVDARKGDLQARSWCETIGVHLDEA